ncbi:hypothetical protein [Ktedonobacter robiniae]|uniref:DUF2178 domain-containing protein n=1 Tax=Ktedonobacter robiniae TaxID=2778365 RepID=A0ABQ3V475_9CHLR|nr:hypothetical protein [Ktedonobacter robiniae]GHO59767.1 hypothetical protein KSB_82420 [Ktedonobacter robiniae]
MNKPARNTYLKILWLPLAVYIIVLIISAVLINISPTSAWWRIPLALIPVVPAAFAMFAYMRFIRRMDELQRHIQLEGLAFGFASVGLLTFSYGFLENIGFPHVSWIYIFPLMLVLWCIGSALAARRYR